MKNLIMLVPGLLCSTYVTAQAVDQQSLDLYIKNESASSWQFNQVLQSQPGNFFTVEPETIRPGVTAHITAVKTMHNDIVANLLFNDAKGDSAILFVLDQEQIHMGQPVFNFSGSHVFAKLLSQTRNPNVGPRYLSYIKAEIVIKSPGSLG